MQDVPHDAMTGEIIEPSVSRGDVMPYGDRFYEAFEKALDELPAVLKKDGDSHQGTYTKYETIVSVVKPILRKHGLLFTHGQESSRMADIGAGSKTRIYPIYTDIIHGRSGQFKRTVIEIPVPKLDAQSAGSAMTYGKRYSLLAALGMATADDVSDDDGIKATPAGVDDDFVPSDLFIQLRDEISEIKKASDLGKWSSTAKNTNRLNQLSDAESGMLRQHYANHKRGLLAEESAS